MTSEGLGEMFEGDSADMCVGEIPLGPMGGWGDRQVCADWEREPLSALAEFWHNLLSNKILGYHVIFGRKKGGEWLADKFWASLLIGC